ncbi:MAG: diguanylate cyclase [Rhodoferax sp.]|uniref:sensor domain-containing diguanylate cyclase n=1 Tax=Rhodoferax sp. TaxID=50421 RepID=UPI0027234566|nr:diguanylate cyclase [Rhodoferax sp.]MDO8448215.1 diguanylate cyclase [Rhodoferax sp.]
MHSSASPSGVATTRALRWRHAPSVTLLASLPQLLLLGATLLVLIWSAVIWEADRLKKERLANFGQNLMRLTEVLDETVVRQLHQIDSALLVMRAEYLSDKPHLLHTVELLRQGPLKDLDVHVTIVGRDGYPEMTDVPGNPTPVYLGDRAHFRIFADGGPDQLYISDPVLGRITKRWGMQMVRPILASDGKFLGIVVVFLPPEQLTRFVQPLTIDADTIMTLVSTTGTLLSRSRDLPRFLGTRLTLEQLAEYRRNASGFVLRRSVLDQVERGIAHRWIKDYPLLLTVARTPGGVYAEIAAAQQLLIVFGGAASLIVLAALALLGKSWRQREKAELLLQREHANLAEAQQIVHIGSWELELASGRVYWSDEVFRIFEIDKDRCPASIDAFLNVIHPDDRETVKQTYTTSLGKREPYHLVHRLRMSDGRIKWVREQGASDFGTDGKPTRSSGTVQDITERVHEQAELEDLSRERLLLLESTGEGIYGIDIKGNCSFINQAAARMLGYDVPEIIGKNIHTLIHHHHADGSPYPMADCPVYQTSTSGQSCEKEDEVFWRKDGTPFPVAYSAHPIRDADRITGTVTTFSDITRRKQAEVELRIAETAFQTQEGMFVTDEHGVILRINSAFTDITGYTAADVVGKNPRIRSSGRHDAAFYGEMWATLKSTGAWKGEIWNRHKNGNVYPESITITAVKGDDTTVTHYVASMHDITTRKDAEEQIQSLAFFDPLTQLPNRRLLQDRMQQASLASARSKSHVALLFIDLDKFKTLNDTLGHDVGDLLLQQVAQRLLSCVREADTVARLGGDEFVVMLEDLGENRQEAMTQAANIGEKILAALNQPYHLGAHVHHSTPSIGATLFSGQGDTVEELIKQADLAMYQVKAADRNALRFFDPAMQATGTDRQTALSAANLSTSP